MAAKNWRRSLRCESGACVEVAFTAEGVYVRDSKNPAVELFFTHEEWDAFRGGVENGEFEL